MNAHVFQFSRADDKIDVSVVESANEPGTWRVEAIADDDDGSVFQAHFIGPNAEGRAREYAAMKYGV